MEASNIKFRCSSLGHLMTNSRSKTEKLSESTKTHLVDVFVRAKYGRRTDIQNKYVAKGLMVEEDSITLFSRHEKTFFKKNEKQLKNNFISGTPDLFEGSDIANAKHIIDVKSSWDIFTFFRASSKKLNKLYYWQLQGYMALTGAQTSTLAYCLVNTPEILVNDEKRRLMWKMGLIDENEDFEEASKEIDRLSVYDDIPMAERIHQITIERNNEDIQSLYERIIECRKYMDAFLFKTGVKEPLNIS